MGQVEVQGQVDVDVWTEGNATESEQGGSAMSGQDLQDIRFHVNL